MRKLLAVALVVVTVLPIAIFATDFTNSPLLQSARERVAQRSGTRITPASEDARRERNRVRRANRRPTPPSVAMAFTFQLAMLTAVGIAGRRMFALRL